ncbi:hypothetical protein GCM10010168_92110 [Actinoplanes ianthinogenes]|uniref:LexA repressor n=1 Tax=Actinoplanes ianthinogenes TaxID=122358 RepID=A0ABM7LNA8_9ACTN|nr:transcriptional repressor LexA [Actinoplanes ianthinogenes]BCJ40765.1 hypothetical protein Aiant_14220 [Actinoplanes ianthinogenes]GGR58717.1 hypothetical protein GCM10010168_92110 [Actinoplanes ianthinogenes]
MSVDVGDEPRPRISAKQERILAVIRESVRERGFPPTVREIGAAVGLVSPSSVAHHLKVLERHGLLRRQPHGSRAVEVREHRAAGVAGPAEPGAGGQAGARGPEAAGSAGLAEARGRGTAGGLAEARGRGAAGSGGLADARERGTAASGGGLAGARGRGAAGADGLSDVREPGAAEGRLAEVREFIRPDQVVAIPVLGDIAAGAPILAEEHVLDHLVVSSGMVGHGTLFALNVKGDSMIDAAICDGDVVVVRQQPVAENGEIVAAMIDGEATVKTFQRRDGHVELVPRNAGYAVIPGDDAVILGKVVSVIRRL